MGKVFALDFWMLLSTLSPVCQSSRKWQGPLFCAVMFDRTARFSVNFAILMLLLWATRLISVTTIQVGMARSLQLLGIIVAHFQFTHITHSDFKTERVGTVSAISSALYYAKGHEAEMSTTTRQFERSSFHLINQLVAREILRLSIMYTAVFTVFRPQNVPRCASRELRTVVLLSMVVFSFPISKYQTLTKMIRQSTPAAGKADTITVTLVTDMDLTATVDGSMVTISGLSNTDATSPVTLYGAGDDGETLFSDGTTQSRGAWSSGTLTLTVHTGLTVAAGTTYTFGFVVTNPASAQVSPTVNIEASGSATIASSAMAKPGTAIYGVTNGADPLLVVVPVLAFTISCAIMGHAQVSLQTRVLGAAAESTLCMSSIITFSSKVGCIWKILHACPVREIEERGRERERETERERERERERETERERER